MEESKLCEICKKKLANVSLWKKDRMVRMCIDCYKDDGFSQQYSNKEGKTMR